MHSSIPYTYTCNTQPVVTLEKQGSIHSVSCYVWLSQVRTSDKNPLLTCLLEGPAGTGKTALAATVGLDSQFPFVKLITAETMVGFSEAAKSGQIAKVFDDAYRVSLLSATAPVSCSHIAPEAYVHQG